FRGELVEAESQCGCETYDPRHIKRAAAAAFLLAAATDLRVEADDWIARTNVQRADSFGAVDLVRREAHQVDIERVDVDGQLADGLGGVAMKQHAARFADASDVGDGLDDADLVVGEHDRDEARVVAKGVGDFSWIEPTGSRAAELLDGEQRHV